MAQWHSQGKLKLGDEFVHESIIGSKFIGRIEGLTTVGGVSAIVPSIEGWAIVTGHNEIIIDNTDPYREGFQVI
jgi:4-hydroxyproline epimerase